MYRAASAGSDGQKKLNMYRPWKPRCCRPVCAPQHFRTDSKCFELPETAEDFVQGFSGVDGRDVRERKVLQVWEIHESGSLQNSDNWRTF